MYASYRTVSKAQGWDDKRRKQGARNAFRHKGMVKSHVQITPDGKVIQHYLMGINAQRALKQLNEALAMMAKEREEQEAKKEEK